MKNLLNNLLKSEDEETVEQIVRSILTNIVNCHRSSEIAEVIKNNLSLNLTPELNTLIEEIATKLYNIQEPEVS